MDIVVTARTVRHIKIDSGRPYAESRADYERVVPSFDRMEAIGVVLSGAGWSAIEGLSAATATHGLVNFFTFDPSPVMALNGDEGKGVTYLSGNIVKAAEGFSVDPASFLYIPLRVMVSADRGGTGILSFDLPQDLFGAFDAEGLVSVGEEFAETFAEILRLIDLPVPAELRP